MISLYSLMASIFLIISSPSWARAETGITTLNQEQIQVLRGRSFFADGFSIRILSGNVDGISRSVVLMGETHFKTKSVRQKAESVVNAFDLYGTEGVELKQYWGNAKALDYMLEFVNAALGPLLQGSTVNSAYENTAVTDADIELQHKREVIELEKNFKPGIQDNLAVLLMPFTFAVTIFGKCIKLSCQTWPSFIMLRKIRNAPVVAVKAVMIYLAVDILSRLMFDEDKWQDNIFIFSTGLLYHRNEFMAENIVEAFMNRPQQQNMLVITGAMHQSGILKILKNEFHFNEIDLDHSEIGLKP
jgi:hypothetical protein